MKRVNQDSLVSIIVLAESSPLDAINQNLQNIVTQTYKNLDIVVSYTQGYDISSVINRWNETSFNIQWLQCNEGLDLLNIPLSKCLGEYIFYKTINPIIWLPRHIEHHIELFKDQKGKALWSYSFLEYKNILEQNQPLNTINWRINTENLQKEQIILDELVHHISLKPEWEKCIAKIENQDNKILFLPGLSLINWKQYRCVNPTEITIIQWMNIQETQQQLGIGKPVSLNNVSEEVIEVDDNLDIKIEFPTLVGNVEYKDHNNKVLERIKKVDPEKIKSIAVKRTIGMGDVILTEPIFKALKIKYPNAKITMFVGNSRGAKDIVKYFKSKPDEIIGIDETLIVQDYLYSQKGFDIRIDLDLSYESHLGYNYIDAYFETSGFEEKFLNDGNDNLELIKYVKDEDKIPKLEYTEERIIKEKYVAFEFSGSGWGGKQIDIAKWRSIVELLIVNEYKIVFVSNQMAIDHEFQESVIINKDNDFNLMLNYIKYCDFFIGTDCGPMHISQGFDKKAFIINGSALSKLTSYSKNIYPVTNKELTCLGCKSRQFLNNNGQGGITFVSVCELSKDKEFSCMKGLTPEYLLKEFENFITTF